MILSDEMVEKAWRAYLAAVNQPTVGDCLRIALLAVLPDIEKAVREDCAEVACEMRRKYGSAEAGGYSAGLWDQGVRIADAIRALPPSTESQS